jgi:hypothetical protein
MVGWEAAQSPLSPDDAATTPPPLAEPGPASEDGSLSQWLAALSRHTQRTHWHAVYWSGAAH